MKRTPLKRKKRMARQKARRLNDSFYDGHAKRPPEYIDEDYLEHLRYQPGRSPDGTTTAPSVPHHARHDANGASLGKNIKDDRRAMSMSRENHDHLHNLSGPFRGWSKAKRREWENQQIAEQRPVYLATLRREDEP